MRTIDRNAPTIKPEDGKRYVLRNGRVTGEVRLCKHQYGSVFNVMQGGVLLSWDKDGFYLPSRELNAYDIVAEYRPSQSAEPASTNCSADQGSGGPGDVSQPEAQSSPHPAGNIIHRHKNISTAQKADEAGIKFDAGKPAWDLLPPDALGSVAAVLTHGAEKYGARNWEKGMSWGRLIGALHRHMAAFQSGEETDPDSGLPHIDHAACCALMVSALVKRGIGRDDRFVQKGGE